VFLLIFRALVLSCEVVSYIRIICNSRVLDGIDCVTSVKRTTTNRAAKTMDAEARYGAIFLVGVGVSSK